jgi:hypothetical protein
VLLSRVVTSASLYKNLKPANPFSDNYFDIFTNDLIMGSMSNDDEYALIQGDVKLETWESNVKSLTIAEHLQL